jgi:glycosyltransferase involved in cell wall biosynthesis
MNRYILYTAFDVVPSPKGASTHILHFLRGLVNGSYQVHLITPGNGLLPEQDSLEGARVTRIPPQPGVNFLAQAVHYGQAVLEHVENGPAYDLVHYRSLWSGLPLAQNRLGFGYKTLFEVNGLPSIELKYHYPGLQDSDLLAKIREQELALLQMSDALVCPSDVTRAFLVSLGVPRRRITVIPNGVNPRDFPAVPLPPDDGHIPAILYIGTLADWQGLDVLIGAMPRLLASRPARLRIVGRGRSRQRKALAKQIRRLGLEEHVTVEPPVPHHAVAAKQIRRLGLEEHVTVEPPVPHHAVAALIAEADVCAAPLGLNDRNITQGCCPIKILEYMSAGRPVVASNLPVARELLREDLDGLLCAPGDPIDLARKLQALLDDRALAQRLAESAAARARERFTWHEAQKRLLRVYAELLGQGKR